jgi:hypothetical protein
LVILLLKIRKKIDTGKKGIKGIKEKKTTIAAEMILRAE